MGLFVSRWELLSHSWSSQWNEWAESKPSDTAGDYWFEVPLFQTGKTGGERERDLPPENTSWPDSQKCLLDDRQLICRRMARTAFTRAVSQYSTPVISLIPVLIVFRIWCFTCTQRSLVLHIPVYTINTNILVSDHGILFVQVLEMFIVYNTYCCNLEIWEIRDHCGLWHTNFSWVRRCRSRRHVCFSVFTCTSVFLTRVKQSQQPDGRSSLTGIRVFCDVAHFAI